MRRTQPCKRILAGPISKNAGLRVVSNLAKFRAFIIKVNNSAYFWSLTAGLMGVLEGNFFFLEGAFSMLVIPKKLRAAVTM